MIPRLLISSSSSSLGGSATGPGSSQLITGTDKDGYFGIVDSSEFPDTAELSTLTGVTAGIVLNTSVNWLKFSIDGAILYVAQKPLRHTIGWSSIAAANCVYGNSNITINNISYKIRLLKGDTVNPATRIGNGTWIAEFTKALDNTIEWGRTIRKCSDGGFASMSTIDLGVTSGAGGSSWCQETANSFGSGYAVIRGGSTNGPRFYGNRNDSSISRGWRPVLELIS